MESALRPCSDQTDSIMSLTLDLKPDLGSRKLVIRKWDASRLLLRCNKFK